MAKYAANTSVPIDRSKAEIERILTRYGADQFAYGWDKAKGAMLAFSARNRQIRIVLPLPKQGERKYAKTPTGRARSESAAYAEWEQDVRSSWRALALVVKAKLEAIEQGIATFEDEWLAYTVLPDGRTVSEHVQEKITAAYEGEQVPALLPTYH